MEILRLENISKRVAQEEILKDINLTVEKGDFVAIVGASGSGKSSLLYIMGLLDAPTHGYVYLDGKRVDFSDRSQIDRIRNEKLGFVFQFHYILPEFTLLENVMLPMLKAGKNIRYARERAMELLSSLGLSGKENRKSYQVSGGELQRTAIARALANDPEILLADEPTGNLDSTNTKKVMDIFMEINRRGTTIVMVTHERDLAAMCKRVVEMKDGRIVQDIRLSAV
ncbi:ABC transporter ATP-binding protein [Thermocrinis minervae]|uniref:Lipoprotein-releasing system ATP-binding protein n=1 Tax=Thermocrinis minervae TaxID=381751 RepID=A0A1M6TEB2_9AQUI|nr:ABC transporter ATP-binding protein [Thermocrinis minervae]SHK55372.1 lipoprotein-releasing system ATP-binding protein [Thermocrinis minervae]